MDKAEIKRTDLKQNFLTTGIIRLDYSGIISIEDKIEALSKYLLESGYTELNEGYIDNLSIKLSDPAKIETYRSISTEEFTRNKSYKFHNPSNRNVIEITKFFITLTINYEFYIIFDNYVSLFVKLVNELSSKQDFIKPLRIGSRKIATLFIRDYEYIHDYFEPYYFINPFKNSNIPTDKPVLVLHNTIDTFEVNKTLVNITSNVLKGIKKINDEDQKVYRVIFDIDCYSNGESVVNIIKNEGISERLTEFNELNFELYKNAVKLQFLNKLMSTDTFSDDNIIEGVRRQ